METLRPRPVTRTRTSQSSISRVSGVKQISLKTPFFPARFHPYPFSQRCLQLLPLPSAVSWSPAVLPGYQSLSPTYLSCC